MSKPDSGGAVAPTIAGPTTETRIDAAHVLAKAQAERDTVGKPSVPEKGAVSAESGESAPLGDQLRIQAAQLAEYLRGRQKELDHRESQLHAQIARLENEARIAKMAFKERVAALEEKERQLKTRQADLDAAEAERERSRKEAEDALARREEALRQREAQAETSGEQNRKVAEEAAERKHKRAEEALQYQKQKIDTHREASQQLVRQMLDRVNLLFSG